MEFKSNPNKQKEPSNNLIFLALICWMFISLLLALSLVGLILFIPKDTYESRDNNPSTWSTIGMKLLNRFLN